MLDEIRKGLIDSHKHRHVEGAMCIACGRTNARLALHVIEFYHSDNTGTPPPLVAMSGSQGTTRGAVPLCSACCPPCAECSLPIATRWTTKLLRVLTARYQGITFVIGNGFCRHVHVLHDLKSLFRPVKLATNTRQDIAQAATKWPLMSAEEIHAFGLEAILPFLEKEGVAIESANRDPGINPQVVGQRRGSLAFIFVRTALYPNKGVLSEAQSMQCLGWAEKHRATAFFASVGLACTIYPNKSPVKSGADMRLPIRDAGFAVAYTGLVVMTKRSAMKKVG